MECITEKTVERTWQAIAQMPPEAAVEAMHRFADAQPNLVDFVMAFSDDVETDARGLSTYLSFVIYQMFTNASGSQIPLISEEQIRAQYEATANLLQSVHASGVGPSPELADLESANQPWVYRYVTEALLDQDDDPEDQLDLDGSNFGEIFMMLKTIIDAVDSATN